MWSILCGVSCFFWAVGGGIHFKESFAVIAISGHVAKLILNCGLTFTPERESDRETANCRRGVIFVSSQPLN